jgi:hypothetical protein
MEIAEELEVGDIVYFERTEAGLVMIRAVTDEILASYGGPVFLLSGVDESGAAIFDQIGRDEFE